MQRKNKKYTEMLRSDHYPLKQNCSKCMNILHRLLEAGKNCGREVFHLKSVLLVRPGSRAFLLKTRRDAT